MSPLGQTYSTAFLITSTRSSLSRRSSSTRMRSRSCCTSSGESAARTASASMVSPRRGIAVDNTESGRHMKHTPFPRKDVVADAWIRFPGLRIVLLPAPSQPYDWWLCAGFVPVHSCGAAPDLHRLPYTPGCAGDHLHRDLVHDEGVFAFSQG